MGQANIRALWELAQENQRKLKACKVHEFRTELPPDVLRRGIHRRLICRNCGGLMLVLDVYTYCLGFKAAGGDPNNVLNNFE